MPRPRRAPRAANTEAAKVTESKAAAVHAEEMETRGRARSTRTSAANMSASDETAIRNANKSRDAALERLATEDLTTTSSEDNTLSSVEVGRRGLGTPLRAADTTGLDLADDMFGDLDESFDIGGDSLLKAPHSAESSTMSLRNLGRQRSRSRQSSFIGRNDVPIRPSSRNGATPLMSSSFNIGVFRRRAREPSILGTHRKSRYDTTGSVTGSINGSVAGSAAGSVAGSVQGSDAGTDRELTPEAESTPLDARRRSARSKAMAGEKAQADISAVSQARKRKSGDDMETGERPEKISRVTPHGDGIDVSDSESELSSLGSPVILPSLERPVTPMRDENVAPPASSDSEDDGAIWPDIQALGRRRRRPSVTHDHLSDVSSPPSLTHSPNYQATKRGRAVRRQRAQSPEITTAHLANLLPKRRVKKTQTHVHEEEVDTSGLAHGDDELQLDARASRQNAGTRASSRNAQTDKALQPRQTPAATTRAVTRSSSRAGKTYSRRASDKENEDQSDEDDDGDETSAFVALPDDTFGEESEERQQFVETQELKAASEKFKEVDMWELSFEEVVEAEEVAPVDAR